MRYKKLTDNPNIPKLLTWPTEDPISIALENDIAALMNDIQGMPAQVVQVNNNNSTGYTVIDVNQLKLGQIVRYQGKSKIVDYMFTVKEKKKRFKKNPNKYMVNIEFTDGSHIKIPVGGRVMVYS